MQLILKVLVLMPFSLCIFDARAASERQWLAGDHHIHSQNSVGWDDSSPPQPVFGGDAIYPIATNAKMAQGFGLDWMVATDHGGPNHSKINLEVAYPELQAARRAVPEVIQFAGLELNTPGADHSSIIIAHSDQESADLHAYESKFDAREVWPVDPARAAESNMLAAVRFANRLTHQPVIIAHHPARSAPDLGVYGLTSPDELRAWNNAAPQIAVGMEGAPGHQAAELRRQAGEDQYPAWVYARGAYGKGFPTLGGFDQMTAHIGGFWDAMLGEGRQWWITANSDSHRHYTEGGIDFWPGEYSKTYVYAHKQHDDILNGIRKGRMFVTTGDLIDELSITVQQRQTTARMGGTLRVDHKAPVTIEIRFHDPETPNAAGKVPTVARVDLIQGSVLTDPSTTAQNRNPTTKVIQRFYPKDWQRDGADWVMTYVSAQETPSYFRVRGTNTEQLEPEPDPLGEDPWQDLWFYSNPVFVAVQP
tara:strand:+ start:1187 stop:2617 length:1431 start_codon:yes stop_codon:yes gene_type:complete